MAIRKYNVSELRRIIAESASEFKPVMGKDVEKDNKTNNEKAYKEMKNATEKYDGGARKETKKLACPNDDNKGMQDLEYTNMGDDFKKRVQAQMKGYTSADAEKKHKNDEFGNAEFNEITNMKEKNKAMADGKQKAKEIGLTSREIDKKEFDKQSKSVFENKVSTLKFKNTVFLTEQHMMQRVPDSFKVEGKKFIMKDKANNEYLIEWAEEPKVLCTSKVNEQTNRIKELFAYQSNVKKSTSQTRLAEDTKINDMLDKARFLMK
jgi:hypothetical protein